MEEHGEEKERSKWTGYYQVNKGDKKLIVHAYEIAGEQWKQGYKVFLKGDGENNFKLLYESERNYHKREKALEAGKLFAEEDKFRFEEKSNIEEIVLSVTNNT